MRIPNALALSLIILALSVAPLGCAKAPKRTSLTSDSSSWNADELLQASRDAAATAAQEANRGEAKDMALKGVAFAEQCLELEPESAGCYFWRAANTGLYYRIRIIGYQRGVKQMIADCKRVIAIDPSYEYGGAYRLLGQIYTQLPQTGSHVDSITRDLGLAESYLHKAVTIAPDYPENQLALAETLFAEGKFSQAIEHLADAKELSSHWRSDSAYPEWKIQTTKLEKKLAKAMR